MELKQIKVIRTATFCFDKQSQSENAEIINRTLQEFSFSKGEKIINVQLVNEKKHFGEIIFDSYRFYIYLIMEEK